MKKYVDYCPRCPRPLLPSSAGARQTNGPPDRNKCHYCTANNLEDMLSAYIEAEWSIEKLREQEAEAMLGQQYHASIQSKFWDRIRGMITGLRIIKIGNMAIVLDNRGDKLDIEFSQLEKL